jgi:hypothetical protein
MTGGLTSCLLFGLDNISVIDNNKASKEQKGYIQAGVPYIKVKCSASRLDKLR